MLIAANNVDLRHMLIAANNVNLRHMLNGLWLGLHLCFDRHTAFVKGGAHKSNRSLIETRRSCLHLDVEALGTLKNILGLLSEFSRQFVYPYLRHSFLRAVDAIRSLFVIGHPLLI
jgi:hypothetical protein